VGKERWGGLLPEGRDGDGMMGGNFKLGEERAVWLRIEVAFALPAVADKVCVRGTEGGL
jgi:hypothetical protein